VTASEARELKSLRVAVLTVSDTRNEATDKSGALLVERLRAAGHVLAAKTIVRDGLGQAARVAARFPYAPMQSRRADPASQGITP